MGRPEPKGPGEGEDPLGVFTVAIDSVLASDLQWGMLPPSGDQAVAQTAAMQLRDTERQAGVRRTL